MSPRLRLAYILSASHSGSTLLAMLLGSHPETCTVGELKATILGDVERYLCSCGARIKQCRFWQRVSEGMSRRGLAFDISDAGVDIRSAGSAYTRRLLRPLHRGPLLERLRDAALWLSPTWHAQLPRFQQRNAALIETITEITRASVVIDSSKIALRLKYLLRNPLLDVRVIRLIRDGRGTVLAYKDPLVYADAQDPALRHSGRVTQCKFRPIDVGAREWRRSNEEAECVLAGVDRSRWTAVHYEDLCNRREATLERLFSFLGLDARQAVKNFRSIERHVIGNGMRFDSTSEVRLDDRWKTVLTGPELQEFDVVAGSLNRRYGYT